MVAVLLPTMAMAQTYSRKPSDGFSAVGAPIWWRVLSA